MSDEDEPSEPSRTPLRLVLDFYRLVGKPVRAFPTLSVPGEETRQLIDLLDEEIAELKLALGDDDLLGVADALGDIAYVVYGAALQFGIDLDRVLESVHNANMSKPNADGTIVRSGEGKILRGDSYRPPALRSVLGLDEQPPPTGDRVPPRE
ncbi:nucleoside triphosphate pyrophosphohydrolase family protein [Actinomadura alba]|uniref:nucleoside triphosphate pyrophosphohydrolase family protein n=1 Tax=Actinomadura alba TaxID=406431 RepID=UPI0031E36F58